MTTPALSVIIVNWNTRELLQNCLNALGLDDAPSYEVVVVDNASADSSPQMVRDIFPEAHLIVNPENEGFAKANNQGIRASTGTYVLLLNSDTIASPTALQGLVNFMNAHPEAGAVSPRLLRPDRTPQPYAFGNDPTPGYLLRRGLAQLLFHRHLHDWATAQVLAADWVAGTCLLVRREVIEQVGLLDENIFMYFEDNDWCLRIRRAGWKIYYNPQVEIVHLGGQSLKKNPQAQQAYYQSLRYFYTKHYGPFSHLALNLMLPLYRRLR